MFTNRQTRPSPAMCVALTALFVALGGTGYAAGQLTAAEGPVGQSPVVKNLVFAKKNENGVDQQIGSLAGIKLIARCENATSGGTQLRLLAKPDSDWKAEVFNVEVKNNTSSTAYHETNGLNVPAGEKSDVGFLGVATGPQDGRKLFNVTLRNGGQIVALKLNAYVSTNGAVCRAYGTATAGTA